jgi:serine protease
MIRCLAILGLLGLSACFIDEPEPETGTVQGSLTPFRAMYTPEAVSAPAVLRQFGERKLSESISKALAAKQDVQRASLSAEQPVEDITIPGDVIIRLEEAHVPEQAALARARLPGYRAVHKGFISEYLHVIGYEPLDKRALTRGETGRLVEQVGKLAGVSRAWRNLRLQPLAVPNDALYSRQWHYPLMNLPAAWDITTGSDSVVIAVLDTGIVRHPDIDSRILQGIDMVSDLTSAGDGNGRDDDPTDVGGDKPNGGSSWHGLHVAGTIGAVSNNGTGVAGVTWQGRLLPVRVLGRQGGSIADIAAGMRWAIGLDVPGMRRNTTPAKIVNMSLGGMGPPSSLLQEVINEGVPRGAIFVIAAGNENVNASNFFPCNQNNVICVGSTGFSGKRSSFSNYGAVVDVMATGGEMSEDLNGDGFPDGVLSTWMNDEKKAGYGYQNGTSMAAPHVAGIVALMVSKNPGLSSAEAELILKETADPTFRCNEGCGAGLVNAQAAVLRAQGGAGDPNAAPKLSVGSTQLSFSSSGTQQLVVRNLGGGTLRVTATTQGTSRSALSFPSGSVVSVSAYGSSSLAVALNTSGMSNGDYTAQVRLAGDNGQTVDVLVKFRVGSIQDKDAIIAFLYKDSAGEWQLDDDAVELVPASTGYAYSMKLPPRTYYAVATIDEDGDGEFFEKGERVGFWRDITNIEPIAVEADQTVRNISFTLLPYQGVDEEPPSRVGDACTSNTQCGGGSFYCDTSVPGGYCTQDCRTKSCPADATCYTFNNGASSLCLASCTGIGGQGTCRGSYVCYSDGMGGGICLPP